MAITNGLTVNDYVESVVDDHVVIRCVTRSNFRCLRQLNGRRRFLSPSRWEIRYSTERDLVQLLNVLRNEGFLFAGSEHGWPPSAIFADLRAKGALEGEFKEVSWSGPHAPTIRMR